MNVRSGFTLVEITIVLGIIAILFAISSLNLSNIAPKTTIDGAVQVLIANLKQQQLYALTGETEGHPVSNNFGIYFGPGGYTLFNGDSYNAADTGNYTVILDAINTSSSSAGSVIIFLKNSGQIENFTPSQNTITLTQINTSQSKTVTINKYGIIESIL